MKQLDLYSKSKQKLKTMMSFPGMPNLYRIAKQHKGYAVVSHERKIISSGRRDYLWELHIFHDGEEVKTVENVNGLIVTETITNILNNL